MDQSPDFVCDGFWVRVAPWLSHLEFTLSRVRPDPNDGSMETLTVGTVRMSTELLKAMTFVQLKHILLLEQESGMDYALSDLDLQGMGVTRQQWNAVWTSLSAQEVFGDDSRSGN